MDKLFVIAIGGTGMRCLESFVHLCAVGMFDNQEIEVMMLDTDSSNGNLGRTGNLISLYNRIKGGEKCTPNTDTFFSAKLNFHKFCTDYNNSSRITYRNISQLSAGDPETQRQNKMLSDLFLDKDTVQEFKLDHGYRAQTHLGSHLMYHGIIEEARKLASGEGKEDKEGLGDFLNKLQSAAESARVFVFGSVFGGTGASSIPIIPVAFHDAIAIRSGGKSNLDLTKTKFGSTLLTEYFSFKKPDQKQLQDEEGKVVADSSFFALNSQAALQFYQQDPTVQSVYKRMYHIGWPLESKSLSQEGTIKTITGGAEQKNNCHIVELLCACAAYEFFTLPDNAFKMTKAEYLFRAVPFENEAFNFTGNDLVGAKGDVLQNKLGAFFSFAHIALSRNGGATNGIGTKAFVKQLQDNNIHKYDTLTETELGQIDEYLKMFAYDFTKDHEFIPGWLFQVKKSVAPGTFIFRNEAFQETEKGLAKLDVGELFLDSNHNWDKGGVFGSRYDTFVKRLTNEGFPREDQHVSTIMEQFLAHIYNGITISQKF